jgi:hypothetical protein
LQEFAGPPDDKTGFSGIFNICLKSTRWTSADDDLHRSHRIYIAGICRTTWWQDRFFRHFQYLSEANKVQHTSCVRSVECRYLLPPEPQDTCCNLCHDVARQLQERKKGQEARLRLQIPFDVVRACWIIFRIISHWSYISFSPPCQNCVADLFAHTYYIVECIIMNENRIHLLKTVNVCIVTERKRTVCVCFT